MIKFINILAGMNMYAHANRSSKAAKMLKQESLSPVPKAAKERFFMEQKLARDKKLSPTSSKETQDYIEELKKTYPLFDEGLGRSVGEALAGDYSENGRHRMLKQKPIDFLWESIAKNQKSLKENKLVGEELKSILKELAKDTHMLGHVFEAEAEIAFKVNDFNNALRFMHLSLTAFETGENNLNQFSNPQDKLEIEAFGISATEPLQHFSSHIKNAKEEISVWEQQLTSKSPRIQS